MLLGAVLATSLAFTVTVHSVFGGSGEVGVSVNVVPLPGSAGLVENVSMVPVGHSMSNAPEATCTGSLKVTVSGADGVTFVAACAGVVLETVGALPVVNVAVKLAAIGTPAAAPVTSAAVTVI